MSLNAYARTAALCQLSLDLRMHFEDSELPEWLPAAADIPHQVLTSGMPCSEAVEGFYALCRMWGISDEAADRLYWDARADLEESI